MRGKRGTTLMVSIVLNITRWTHNCVVSIHGCMWTSSLHDGMSSGAFGGDIVTLSVKKKYYAMVCNVEHIWCVSECTVECEMLLCYRAFIYMYNILLFITSITVIAISYWAPDWIRAIGINDLQSSRNQYCNCFKVRFWTNKKFIYIISIPGYPSS